jgi:hypothetical protein
MLRRLFYDLLLFLLPFALYWIYIRFGGRTEPRPTPWTILFISGLVLVVVSFVWLGVAEDVTVKGNYVPAHVENGKVVSGHFEGNAP